MKKTLIALAAVAATSAFAQSSVTLYGIVDAGYGTTTTKNAAGATTAKTSGMVNGIQSGNRWGVKGTEDLGGGMKAHFNLEEGFTLGTGADGGGFARRSVLELEGGFGKFGMGRDYTPSFSLIAGADVTGVDATSTSNVLFGVRNSNGFTYTSPSFGGVTLKATLVNEKSGSPTSAKVTGHDISATYSNGPLMVGASMYDMDTMTAAVTADAAKYILGVAATDKTLKGSVIGASYDFGVAKVYFNQINSKTTDNLAVTTAKNNETNLGAAFPMGAATFIVGVGRDNDTTTAGVKASSTDTLLGVNYSLSKRTNVYARYTQNKASTSASTNAGGKSTTMAVGLRHTF